jgi:hypothetical protein
MVPIIMSNRLKHCWHIIVACAVSYEKHIKDSEMGHWSA